MKGDGIHPLYSVLTAAVPTATQKPGGEFSEKLKKHGIPDSKPGEIRWNFEKFLLSRRGKVVARFAPDLPPDDAIIIKAIEVELNNK